MRIRSISTFSFSLIEMLGAISLSFGITACHSPSQIDTNFLGAPSAASSPTPFTKSFTFNVGNAANYSYDASKIDFTGGVAELTGSSFTDNSNAASGFGGGTLTGTAWSTATDGLGGSNYMMLSQSGSATDLELDSSWTPAWSNIILYWKLNESANSASVADSGPIGTNTGTVFNSTDVTLGASGKLNTAALFASSGEIWTQSNIAAFSSSSSFSVAFWMNSSYLTALGSDVVMVSHESPFEARTNSSGNISFGTMVGGILNYLTTNSIVVNSNWNHVVMTYDGSYKKVYVNGVLDNSAGYSGNLDSTANRFAVSAHGGDGYNYVGSIDDVAIWNIPLSAAAVATIYQHESAKYAGSTTSRVVDALVSAPSWTSLGWTSTLPFNKALPDNTTTTPVSESQANYSSLYSGTLMNGIQGLWHLDETSGATFIDKSGNGNNATLNGSTNFNIPGMLSNGFSPNSSGYLDAGNPASLQLASQFTISGWYLTKSPSAFEAIASKGGGSIAQSAYELRNNFGALQVSSYIGGTQYSAASAITPSSNTWYHMVGTYDGSTLKLYVNGTIAQGVPATGAVNNPALNFNIGRRSGDGLGKLSGIADEVAIWSRALNSTEVSQLYRRGANRIKYQVQSCSTQAGCTSSPAWQGPDGTNQTYFSELYNTLANAASGAVQATSSLMTFLNFISPANGFTTSLSVPTNRYFQYRAIMESDDTGTGCNYGSGATWCSPELQSVSIAPTHYDNSGTTITSNSGVSFVTLTGFTETFGGSGCPSGTLYNLSKDGTNWYYWNGSAWTLASGTPSTANAASLINTNISSFPAQFGTGSLYFKSFLQSSGTPRAKSTVSRSPGLSEAKHN